MTYEKLYELKFEKQFPTHVLEKRYPRDRQKISQIALLELSSEELKSIVRREKELACLLMLKNRLFKKTVTAGRSAACCA